MSRSILFLPGERTEDKDITFYGRSAFARQRIDDAYFLLFEQGHSPRKNDLAKARILLDEADEELDRIDSEDKTDKQQ